MSFPLLHAVVPNHIDMPVHAFIDGIFVRTFERATHEKLSYDCTSWFSRSHRLVSVCLSDVWPPQVLQI